MPKYLILMIFTGFFGAMPVIGAGNVAPGNADVCIATLKYSKEQTRRANSAIAAIERFCLSTRPSRAKCQAAMQTLSEISVSGGEGLSGCELVEAPK